MTGNEFEKGADGNHLRNEGLPLPRSKSLSLRPVPPAKPRLDSAASQRLRCSTSSTNLHATASPRPVVKSIRSSTSSHSITRSSRSLGLVAVTSRNNSGSRSDADVMRDNSFRLGCVPPIQSSSIAINITDAYGTVSTPLPSSSSPSIYADPQDATKKTPADVTLSHSKSTPTHYSIPQDIVDAARVKCLSSSESAYDLPVDALGTCPERLTGDGEHYSIIVEERGSSHGTMAVRECEGLYYAVPDDAKLQTGPSLSLKGSGYNNNLSFEESEYDSNLNNNLNLEESSYDNNRSFISATGENWSGSKLPRNKEGLYDNATAPTLRDLQAMNSPNVEKATGAAAQHARSEVMMVAMHSRCRCRYSVLVLVIAIATVLVAFVAVVAALFATGVISLAPRGWILGDYSTCTLPCDSTTGSLTRTASHKCPSNACSGDKPANIVKQCPSFECAVYSVTGETREEGLSTPEVTGYIKGKLGNVDNEMVLPWNSHKVESVIYVPEQVDKYPFTPFIVEIKHADFDQEIPFSSVFVNGAQLVSAKSVLYNAETKRVRIGWGKDYWTPPADTFTGLMELVFVQRTQN